MLGVHRLSSRGADYYLSDLARELPVSGREGRGQWLGGAAAGLGLSGSVDPEHLRTVLDGRNPATGRRLRSDRATVLGFDLTFSAPKSASVLFALGGEEAARQVVAAHHEAARGALVYLEQHGVAARRGSGEGRDLVPTNGLVAGSFTHGVNRNQDPHLHSHVVVANMVHGHDSRWSACDQRGLWAHRNAAGAVYDAHLRAELSARLGVRWTEGSGRRTEVSGVSPLLIGEFSSRAADIRRHATEWGSHSARGARVAWAATRPSKPTSVSFDALRRQWERRAEGLGMARAESKVADRTVDVPPRPTLGEHRFRAVLSQSTDGAARRRDVVEALGVAAVGGTRAPALERLTDLWVPATGDVGVAEPTHQLRRVVPGDHLLAELGPRPLDPGDHEVWRSGAVAIEAYRRRWGVTRSTDALGDDARRLGPASLPAARLADHVRTERQVAEARQRLGWRAPQVMEMDRGR